MLSYLHGVENTTVLQLLQALGAFKETSKFFVIGLEFILV
jgi:hypothetical protein